jgi:hypothetical protein
VSDALETRWWLCPNRSCEHGNILHDRDDYYEGVPTCCVEGCPCGHEPDGAP